MTLPRPRPDGRRASPAEGPPRSSPVHGITGNGLNWSLLGQVLADRFGSGAVRLLAPDLQRARGQPIRTGSAGLDVHVHDLAALARSLPAPPLVLGHSMGAGRSRGPARGPLPRHRVRVSCSSTVGSTSRCRPGMGEEDIDKTLRVVLGPAMKRLGALLREPRRHTWSLSPITRRVGPLLARAGRRAHPALPRARRATLTRPSPAEVVSSCSLGRDPRGRARRALPPALSPAADARDRRARDVPVDFLWAVTRALRREAGSLRREPAGRCSRCPHEVRVTHVPDTNHYSIVLSALARARSWSVDAGGPRSRAGHLDPDCARPGIRSTRAHAGRAGNASAS
jgi:hypothetical protein